MIYTNKEIQEKCLNLSYREFSSLLKTEKVRQDLCETVGKISIDEFQGYYVSIDMLGPGCGSIYKIISQEDFEDFENWTKERNYEIMWSTKNMLYNGFTNPLAWMKYTFRPSDYKEE